jgi:hypothetical protein
MKIKQWKFLLSLRAPSCKHAARQANVQPAPMPEAFKKRNASEKFQRDTKPSPKKHW